VIVSLPAEGFVGARSPSPATLLLSISASECRDAPVTPASRADLPGSVAGPGSATAVWASLPGLLCPLVQLWLLAAPSCGSVCWILQLIPSPWSLTKLPDNNGH